VDLRILLKKIDWVSIYYFDEPGQITS
jgi:hypothetical protein